MAESVLIKCAESSSFLEMANWNGNDFEVVLCAPNFRGAVKVYEPGFGASVASFFREIATESNGWKGTKDWSSLEGELSLAAECDSTGHITLKVKIQHHTGQVWRLEGFVILEAGQLETIARSVERFFERN
jgi:hypothetical protein